MGRNRTLGWGIVLILVGAYFMAVQFNLLPDIMDLYDWPFWVIMPGVIFLLIAALTGTSGMAVPGAIITGVGLILYYYNETNHWENWTLWLLIPGFVGIGTFFMYVLERKFSKALREGGGAILWSIAVYFIFTAIFGGWNPLGIYWPILVILYGLWLLARPFFRSKKRIEEDVDVI